MLFGLKKIFAIIYASFFNLPNAHHSLHIHNCLISGSYFKLIFVRGNVPLSMFLEFLHIWEWPSLLLCESRVDEIETFS